MPRVRAATIDLAARVRALQVRRRLLLRVVPPSVAQDAFKFAAGEAVRGLRGCVVSDYVTGCPGCGAVDGREECDCAPPPEVVKANDAVAPPPPDHGQPCNGCGVCCIQSVCQVGVIAGAGEAPCGFLLFHDGRFWCGIVEMERRTGIEPMVATALGIGRGCDADSAALVQIRRHRATIEGASP